jgi:hypothetical protein
METEAFLKMDIFFVVTTAAIAVVGALMALALFYVVRIVRDISEITRTVKTEAKEFVDDLSKVRTDVKEGVHEVRENISEGIETAKTYSRAVAGTGIVKAVSQLLEAFAEEKGASEKRRRTRKKKSE